MVIIGVFYERDEESITISISFLIRCQFKPVFSYWVAFGVLMQVSGLGIGWAMLMSIYTFAGSIQFVAVSLLCAAFNPIYAFFLALMVNARHLFYGISMLKKFRGSGKWKPFLIFSLCDETFSILSSVKAPSDIDSHKFMFSNLFYDSSHHPRYAFDSILAIPVVSRT